jgi:hypothetical protein
MMSSTSAFAPRTDVMSVTDQVKQRFASRLAL